MAKPQQTASELSRTLAGQWTKTQKRAAMSRSIMESNQRTKAINKAFKQQQFMKNHIGGLAERSKAPAY